MLAVHAPTAHAGDVEEARRLFAEGVRLYQRGDYEGARRLFKQADAEHHAPAIVYNLGLAEEKLGHPQAAVDAYEAYVAEVGESGELAPAAAVAIAQLKARSTRLRVESRPPGARVFVDGAPLREPAPTSILVPAAHHVVVVQGEGWRAERDIEAPGGGEPLGVVLEAPEAPPVVPAPSPPPHADAPKPPPAAPAPAPRAPDGIVWGAAFAFAPYYLRGVSTPGASNEKDARSVVAGPVLEIGLALTPEVEFLARGFAALGPDGKPSYAYMGGPGLSAKLGSAVWVGATFLGGQLETRAHDARYGTDLVFGAMAEVGLVVLRKPAGEWIASMQPGFLLTELRNDNTAFFLPIAFGYRAY